jgi:hypothetical protein
VLEETGVGERFGVVVLEKRACGRERATGVYWGLWANVQGCPGGIYKYFNRGGLGPFKVGLILPLIWLLIAISQSWQSNINK